VCGKSEVVHAVIDDGGDHEESLTGKVQFSAVRIPTVPLHPTCIHRRRKVRLCGLIRELDASGALGCFALRVTFYLLVRLSADS
jgi:hypothetical protein